MHDGQRPQGNFNRGPQQGNQSAVATALDRRTTPHYLLEMEREYGPNWGVLRETICKDLSWEQMAHFLSVARSRGLDPLKKQIYAVLRLNRKENRKDMTIQTSIEGFRAIAERTGKYGGQKGPWWCGPDGQWHDVWTDEKRLPVAARIGMVRRGWDEPLYQVIHMKEFFQTGYEGKPSGLWGTMPIHMLAIRVEGAAFRRTYPEEFDGIELEGESEDEAELGDATVLTVPIATPPPAAAPPPPPKALEAAPEASEVVPAATPNSAAAAAPAPAATAAAKRARKPTSAPAKEQQLPTVLEMATAANARGDAELPEYVDEPLDAVPPPAKQEAPPAPKPIPPPAAPAPPPKVEPPPPERRAGGGDTASMLLAYWDELDGCTTAARLAEVEAAWRDRIAGMSRSKVGALTYLKHTQVRLGVQVDGAVPEITTNDRGVLAQVSDLRKQRASAAT